MNYFEFKSLVDLRDMNPTEKTITELVNCIGAHTEFIRTLLDMVKEQREEIDRLKDTVDKIAPDIDLIETMAETPEEEAELIDRYMNHNSEWSYDSGWYKPKEIIEEMAQGDEDKRKFLNGCLEEDGAHFVTRLYKKWKGIDHEQNIINKLKL